MSATICTDARTEAARLGAISALARVMRNLPEIGHGYDSMRAKSLDALLFNLVANSRQVSQNLAYAAYRAGYLLQNGHEQAAADDLAEDLDTYVPGWREGAGRVGLGGAPTVQGGGER